MTIEQVTLIAAIIAALASLITLILNFFASRASEFRAAHREILKPHLHDLSQALYSTIATTKILSEAKTEPAIENWRERANDAKSQLKDLRIRLRYPLWGITDSMNTLSRIPDWIEHARPLPSKHSSALFKRGRSLGIYLDGAIRNSYAKGRPPTWVDRARVAFAKWRLERTYKGMKSGRKSIKDMAA